MTCAGYIVGCVAQPRSSCGFVGGPVGVSILASSTSRRAPDNSLLTTSRSPPIRCLVPLLVINVFRRRCTVSPKAGLVLIHKESFTRISLVS